METEFAKLLEKYLDEEQMALKMEEEEELVDCQSQTKANFSIEDAISIDKYVNEYLGIQGDCSNLLHCGLKDLESEYVLGVSNEFANKNPELVKRGWLLIVIDSHHKRGTYINPVYLREYMARDNIEEEMKILRAHIVTELKLLKNYYEKWQVISKRIENNQRFYHMLEETHKLGKVKKLECREKKLCI